jgi:hypothetical protein
MESGSAVLDSGGNGVNAHGSSGTEFLIDISDAVVSYNALAGLRLDQTKITGCRVRGTSFAGNGQSGLLIGSGGNCDLGTAAAAGGNVFGNVGPNLVVDPSSTTPAFTVPAVGNTWTANEQGADGAGRYAVPAGQTVLEATGKVLTGANYRLQWTNATLRLAE